MELKRNMMRAKRFRYEYRENASSLHKQVGELLRNSPLFKTQEIYQEYPLDKVNSKYKTRYHYDWVIPKLKIIVECHGAQHYEPVAFNGDENSSIEQFHALQRRDKFKKEAAIAVGYIYITVPYTSEKILSEIYLINLYERAKKELLDFQEEQKIDSIVKFLQGTSKDRKDDARKYRRGKYNRLKELKNANKRSAS